MWLLASEKSQDFFKVLLVWRWLLINPWLETLINIAKYITKRSFYYLGVYSIIFNRNANPFKILGCKEANDV